MSRFFFLLGVTAGVFHAAGQDIDSILSNVRDSYNLIETFSADATIYEYFG